MDPVLFNQLITLSASGIGVIGLGVTSIVFARYSHWVRLGVSLLVLGGSISLAAVLTPLNTTLLTAAILGILVALSSVAFWKGSSHLTDRFLAFCRQPLARGFTAVIVGLLMLSYAVAKFEHDDNQMLEEHMQFLELVSSRPTLIDSSAVVATDHGKALGLSTSQSPRDETTITVAEKQALQDLRFADRVIRTGPASDTCNCHGWVFTDGQYWVDAAHVDTILKENGYLAVTDPKPGDVVVYRENEMPSHTAIVRYIAAGKATMVEGKWGWMGVFMHPVEFSCYGNNYTYYRSPRSGHVLVGLGGKPASGNTVPVTSSETQKPNRAAMANSITD